MKPGEMIRALRYARVFKSPSQALQARKRPGTGAVRTLELRHAGALSVRDGTTDMRVVREVIMKDVYGLRALRKQAERGRKLGTVVDIGGHIGIFASQVAPLCERVISCEPMPANRELFERNVRAMGATNVTLEPLAVAESAGEVALRHSTNLAGHSILPSFRGDGQETRVETISLAELFTRHGVETCDLLKVDCEGGEYGILLTCGDEFDRVQRVVLEYHDARGEDPSFTGDTLEKFLRARGFTTQRKPSRQQENHGTIVAHRNARVTG